MKAKEFIKERLIVTKEDWIRAMEDYAESKLKDRNELISGLVRDFDEVISDNDIEPERAGYLAEAKELLKQEN